MRAGRHHGNSSSCAPLYPTLPFSFCFTFMLVKNGGRGKLHDRGLPPHQENTQLPERERISYVWTMSWCRLVLLFSPELSWDTEIKTRKGNRESRKTKKAWQEEKNRVRAPTVEVLRAHFWCSRGERRTHFSLIDVHEWGIAKRLLRMRWPSNIISIPKQPAGSTAWWIVFPDLSRFPV